jgi:hypothetical protein
MIQVHARTPGLEIFATRLADLFALPDVEAAPALNQRMVVLDQVHRIHELTYPEIGIISREMEKRHLYKYLIDPDTDQPFPNFSAWASCSNFLACRRIIFESKRDLELLADVPAEKLISVSKSNIKILTQLSSAVRNDPAILAAAKTDDLAEKVEREHPDQHLEVRKPIRLNPGRSEAQDIERWVEYAIEHDIAGSLTEAVVRACQMALHDAELDDELAKMPMEAMHGQAQ